MFIASILICLFALSFGALQPEREKPQAERWSETFIENRFPADEQQRASLVRLLAHVAQRHLAGCTLAIRSEQEHEMLLGDLLAALPQRAYLHGNASDDLGDSENAGNGVQCVHHILLLGDVMRARFVLRPQVDARVVLVSSSSQWRVHEFLSSEHAQQFVNLLVVAQSERKSSTGLTLYVLYTHDTYIDGLGASRPRLLTSWRGERLSRPHVRLFPRKMAKGFAGHRFIIAVADQPPYVMSSGRDGNDDLRWDGVELRIMQVLSELLNFTRDYHEARSDHLGPGDAVIKATAEGQANLGLAGLYVTDERLAVVDMSPGHSQDCAAFVSLTSTALPRYRAILGPFQLSVWIALTAVYLFAIFPLSFSDKLTLKHLIRRPEEMENMFWYVFGTFTNAFSFGGRDSWSTSSRLSTRLFVGWYWIFTIIITACYTGSVIAFVTLPVQPTTVDTARQLVSGRFRTGTLDRGGWEKWFDNSSDSWAERLLKDMELLPDVQSGLKNITNAWLWPYAFLGSRDHLDYIVRTNFTTSNKRSVLHIANECFAPFSVSVAYPKGAVYRCVLDAALLRVSQAGLVAKARRDFEWDVARAAVKPGTTPRLQANAVGRTRLLIAEDRSLTLADTQGMFLLLAAGYILAGSTLLSEWLGGCFNLCRKVRPVATASEPPESIEDVSVKSNQQSPTTSIRSERRTSTPSDSISDMFNFDYLFGENNVHDTPKNHVNSHG